MSEPSTPTEQGKALRPQPGPQEMFSASTADIAILGGSAGGGKSVALLMEPLHHYHVPGFGAVMFRRSYPEIMNQGALWDESMKVYGRIPGADPKRGEVQWRFGPVDTRVAFRHLGSDDDLPTWHGSQIPLICWDELTLFSQKSFFYMLSRNRSTCGVKPYVRGSCNPDADSWVADFISWWIDQDSGYAIPERSGKIRWMFRIDEKLIWGDTREEVMLKMPHEIIRFELKSNRDPRDLIKSVTFIRSSIYDNRELLEADPSYLSNLLALPLIERERLLNGNWKIKATAGKVFNRAWFNFWPADAMQGGTLCRFWDFAATEKKIGKKGHDPDFTAGVLMRKLPGPNGLPLFVIEDVIARRLGPAQADELYINTARDDKAYAKATGAKYLLRFEEEGGASGKRDAARLIRMAAGLDVEGVAPQGDKLVRSRPLAAQAVVGNVKLLVGEWNEEFLTHMHHQPEWAHDDIHDAVAGSFNALNDAPKDRKHSSLGQATVGGWNP